MREVEFMKYSTSYFSVAMRKYHDQEQVMEERIFWLMVPEE